MRQGSGAYTEYSVYSVSKVYVLPSGLKPGMAAACLSQGLTALVFIKKTHHVQKDDSILVQGASRGAGLWFCWVLRVVCAWFIGTASLSEKMKLAKENSAEFVLNYSSDNIVARVMELTDKRDVSTVFDSVGVTTFKAGMQALTRDGTMVLFRNTSDNVPPISLATLLPKNLRLMRLSVFGYL
jgi:NADPH2:quinone reductase